MSLVGFRAQNHPQQRKSDDVDDRGTTADLFDPLHARYGFTVDVAAAAHNAKCGRYYTRDDDGLAQPWTGETVWCNPPYSDIEPWVAKAWTEHPTTNGIVMLLPNNRQEQRWWQQLIEPYRDRVGSPLTTEYLAGRARRRHRPRTAVPRSTRPRPRRRLNTTQAVVALVHAAVINHGWTPRQLAQECGRDLADVVNAGAVITDRLRRAATHGPVQRGGVVPKRPFCSPDCRDNQGWILDAERRPLHRCQCRTTTPEVAP
jgi:hypothetical protein